jgi:GNAT superfamily N-acetyltransferase
MPLAKFARAPHNPLQYRRSSRSGGPQEREARLMEIRRFKPEDAAGVTRCIAELQDYERGIGQVVGFAAVQSRVPNEDSDERDYNFALISDLGVNESHRGAGIGRALIAACEAFARNRRARWLRIAVLGRNTVARGLYERCGFEDRQVLLEKPLAES